MKSASHVAQHIVSGSCCHYRHHHRLHQQHIVFSVESGKSVTELQGFSPGRLSSAGLFPLLKIIPAPRRIQGFVLVGLLPSPLLPNQ